MFWKNKGWKRGKGNRVFTFCIICSLGFLFLGGCREFNPLDLKTEPELVEVVIANRTVNPLSEEEIKGKVQEILYSYEEFKEIDPDKIQFLRGKTVPEINEEEALEDVEFFFKL